LLNIFVHRSSVFRRKTAATSEREVTLKAPFSHNPRICSLAAPTKSAENLR